MAKRFRGRRQNAILLLASPAAYAIHIHTSILKDSGQHFKTLFNGVQDNCRKKRLHSKPSVDGSMSAIAIYRQRFG
jgi:hypothetical protein